MKVFTCRDRFEDILTTIYVAWEEALKIGHENVAVMREPVEQISFFDEYIHVENDEHKAESVIRSIREKISDQAYVWVYYASLSEKADAIQTIYEFLRIGFKAGPKVTEMMALKPVMDMMEMQRKVGNEAGSSREFARFTPVGNVYICHMEPKNNITIVMGNYFADRMPSEYWMIVDDKRKTAIVHPKDEEIFVKQLSEEEFQRLLLSHDYEDEVTKLWKTFFDAIGIEQRKNETCQRNHFPIWMRKNAPEFAD